LPTERTAYNDHSNVGDEWIEQRRRDLLPADGKVSGGAKKKFPIQLYHMLEAVDGTSHSLLVRWLPHGRSFMVFDTNRFAIEVLQLYFPSQSKFTSFQRQLNIYGFLRCTRVDEGYYHELFLRGRPALAALIPRPAHGQHTSRRTFDPTSEPNLYSMVWLPDVAVQMDLVDSADVEGATDSATGNDGIHPSTLQRSYPPSSQMPRPARNNPDVRMRRSTQSSDDGNNSSQDQRTSSTYTPHTISTGILTDCLSARHGQYFEHDEVSIVRHQLPALNPQPAASVSSEIPDNKQMGSTRSATAIVTDRDGSSHPMMRQNTDSDWMLPHLGTLTGSDSEDVINAAMTNVAAIDASRRAPHQGGRTEGAGLKFANRLEDAKVEGETESDKVERSSTSSSDGNLDEWVEFLHDVDLD
jgi:HSF-type DNA-binding